MLRFGAASSGAAIELPPSHPLRHPDRPRREWKAIPAGAGFFPRRIDRPPNGPAIALCERNSSSPPSPHPSLHHLHMQPRRR
jgi:hypothetical protein